jgi:hypothetical protein
MIKMPLVFFSFSRNQVMSVSATKSFKAFCASITSSSGSVVSSPAHAGIAANASDMYSGLYWDKNAPGSIWGNPHFSNGQFIYCAGRFADRSCGITIIPIQFIAHRKRIREIRITIYLNAKTFS